MAAAKGKGKGRGKAARGAAPKAKSNRGGRRLGAGRKSKEFTLLRAEILATFDRQNVEALPRLLENMMRLANGGYERVETKYTPEVTVQLVPAGQEPAAPRMVASERKVSVAEPDRAANQYLIDRVLGRPRQAVELSGPDGGAIPVTIEAALKKVYGDECSPQP